jgi:hypothetical protein
MEDTFTRFASFLGQQAWQERFDEVQWSVEIHVDYLINCIKFEVVDANEGLNDAGHVDYSVDGAQSFGHLCRQRQHILAIGDVDGERRKVFCCGGGERSCFFQSFAFDIETGNFCSTFQ